MEHTVEELRVALVERESSLLTRVEKSLLDQIALRDNLAKISHNLEMTIDGLKDENKGLKKELATANQSNQSYLGERTQFQQYVQQLQTEGQQLIARVAELEAQIEVQKQAIESINQEKQDMKTTHETEWKSSSSKHLEEMTLLNNRYQMELRNTNELRREKDFLTSENNQLGQTVVTIEESLEETEKKLFKTVQANKELRAEKESLSLQLRGCQRQMQDLSIEVGDIKQKEVWQNLENELKKKEKLKEKERIESIVAELDDLSQKFQSAVKELDKRKVAEDELKSLNDELYRENMKLASELKTKKAQLGAAEDEITRAVAATAAAIAAATAAGAYKVISGMREEHSPDGKVYYLTCLKCKEWEELQQASMDSLTRLTDELGGKESALAANESALAAKESALAVAIEQNAAVSKEYKDRRDEMLSIISSFQSSIQPTPVAALPTVPAPPPPPAAAAAVTVPGVPVQAKKSSKNTAKP